MDSSKFAVAGCIAMLLASPSLAQQNGRPQPADAKAITPPVVYVSPLTSYRRLAEDEVAPWKASNQAVEQAGGWKAYAREAQQPAPATKPFAQPPSQKPPTDAHSGHH
jgi:hypothetical protein